jgi:hypothetical protein
MTSQKGDRFSSHPQKDSDRRWSVERKQKQVQHKNNYRLHRPQDRISLNNLVSDHPQNVRDER